MKNTALGLVFAAFALVSFIQPQSVRASGAPERLIAVMLPANAAKATAAWKALGLNEKYSIPQLNAHVLTVPSGVSSDTAIGKLSQSGLFAYVEKDQLETASMTPNDPDYSEQWELPKVDFSKAWSTSTGAGITVAVLDSGIDCSLSEFGSQCVSGWNVVDNNSNTNDDIDHGTPVAGQIGAATNNGIDVAGAAFNAKLMPVKINQDGQNVAYASDIAAGIVWGADHGAKVENLSWSNNDGSEPAQVELDAAFYLRQKGGILFESAGNSGIQTTWATSVIDTISATDNKNKFASFSNSGKAIDFAAPGVNIPILTTDGNVGESSGTSISSPLAASVAALMLSENPSLLPWQVENLMMLSTTDKGKDGWDQKYGWGVIDAKASVDNAFANPGPDVTPPDPAVIYAAGYNGTTASFSWNAAYDNTGYASSYLVYRNGTKIGKTNSVTFADPNPVHGQTSNYSVKAVDAAGNNSVFSNIVPIYVP